MSNPNSFGPNLLRFWGVRGSIPTPGPETVRYGGNTSCIEIRADGELIVLDAGSGLRKLGLALQAEFGDRTLAITMLISHTHWDHIQGFPFFGPLYRERNSVHILGFEGARSRLSSAFTAQMESPFFPVAMTSLPSNITIEELRDLDCSVGPIQVVACYANHPGVAVGYRLNTSTASIVYLPDNETIRPGCKPHDGPPGLGQEDPADTRQRQLDFLRDADIAILDAQYNEEEYEAHQGWGHGCVNDVVQLAIEAGVKRLFLFHHDPAHDDAFIEATVARARQQAREAGSEIVIEAAQEGAEVGLGQPGK